jgi:predicted ATPase
MIKKIKIESFKSLSIAELKFEKLNILTGTNSAGKSSVIQALLLTLSNFSQPKQIYLKEIVKQLSFKEVCNYYLNAKVVDISLTMSDGLKYSINITEKSTSPNITETRGRRPLKYEENLQYLSANRIGPEALASYSEDLKIGHDGKYAIGYYEQMKDKPVDIGLIKSTVSNTLKEQIRYWLSFILDISIDFKTEKITEDTVKALFSIDELDDISPMNTGAGNSYLLKILVMCLTAKKNDVLIIENPEIHLHPKAQAKLGSFFGFVSNAGIQLIIETHCEHLINKIRYEVFQKNLRSEDVAIYYKNSIREDFQKININLNGQYTNETNQIIKFPSGFFDSTLEELLEIS